MSERGKLLHATVDQQIGELIDLITAFDPATLRLPCPSRDKLGDGTIAACAQHTADNYQRIVAFVQNRERMSGAHGPAQHGGHSIPGFLRVLGLRPPDQAQPGPGVHHDDRYTADKIDPGELVSQLSTSRAALGQISTLTYTQLKAIPPDGSFRFANGQRTLDQVLASLLQHQDHQVKAVRAALA